MNDELINEIDISAEAENLLEALGNSIHDREINKDNPFTFNIKEIRVAENMLNDFKFRVIMEYKSNNKL